MLGAVEYLKRECNMAKGSINILRGLLRELRLLPDAEGTGVTGKVIR